MGHTIWVDVQDRAEARTDCGVMLRLEEPLDAMCTRLGVAKLSDFYDYSALEEAYGDLLDEAGEAVDGGGDEDGADEDKADDAADDHTLAGEWHEPGAALEAVRALRARLGANFGELGFAPEPSQSHWPGYLMEELAHAEQMLRGAAARGQRFRFLIVP